MTLKKTLQKSPRIAALVRGAYTRTLRIRHAQQSKKALNQLAQAPHPLGPVLSQAILDAEKNTPNPTFDAIETQRRRLLNTHSPLKHPDPEQTLPRFDQNTSVAMACQVSKPPRPARLLHDLTKHLAPQRILEFGTNVGISSAYLASAIHSPESDNPSRVVTLDISAARQAVAQSIHANLPLAPIDYVLGPFDQTLDNVLQDQGPFDLVFIDGNHQYQPTLDYMEKALAHTAGPMTLVFDDIRWSPGMLKAWEEIKADKRFDFVADLYAVGIVTRPAAPTEPRFVSDPVCFLY